MANDAVTIGQWALAGSRDAMSMADTRDRNGAWRSKSKAGKGGPMPQSQGLIDRMREAG